MDAIQAWLSYLRVALHLSFGDYAPPVALFLRATYSYLVISPMASCNSQTLITIANSNTKLSLAFPQFGSKAIFRLVLSLMQGAFSLKLPVARGLVAIVHSGQLGMRVRGRSCRGSNNKSKFRRKINGKGFKIRGKVRWGLPYNLFL